MRYSICFGLKKKKKKEVEKSIDRVSVSWCECIQTEANPDQEISSWTLGPNFSFSEAWATTGHRLRDLQAVWKMPLIIMLKHFFFFLFLSWLSPARKAETRSLHHQPQTPGTGEITLYLLSHKVTVKVWWREHTVALMWCWIPRNTSDASSQPAARTKLHF